MTGKQKKYLIRQTDKAPDTGKMLTEYIKSNRIYQSALSRKLGRNVSTLKRFKKRSTIQTAILWELCNALNYNFISDLAAQLPPEMPARPTLKDQRIAELEKQVQELKSERDNLQRVIDIFQRK
ncbi:MAG: helix-turn-helix domain-containing protein [Bacteroidia bacterium]